MHIEAQQVRKYVQQVQRNSESAFHQVRHPRIRQQHLQGDQQIMGGLYQVFNHPR